VHRGTELGARGQHSRFLTFEAARLLESFDCVYRKPHGDGRVHSSARPVAAKRNARCVDRNSVRRQRAEFRFWNYISVRRKNADPSRGNSRLLRSMSRAHNSGLDASISVVSASDQRMDTAKASVARNLRTLVYRALGFMLGGLRHGMFLDQCRFGGDPRAWPNPG
jgi:hypothetical protein